jgi:hypothetical protein
MSAWHTNDVVDAAKLNQTCLLVDSTAPTSPTQGKLWYDTTKHQLKTYNADAATWKVAGSTKIPLAWDDTYKEAKGTSEVQVKYARLIKSVNVAFDTVRVLASLGTDNALGTAYLKVYVDEEVSARLTLSTIATGETAVEGSFDISDLNVGVHTLKFKLSNSSASYTSATQLLTILGEEN